MKKSKKSTYIAWGIIIVIIILSTIYIISSKQNTPELVAKCMGKNSLLYTQLGCHACETQEQMFGENSKYLNIVDCRYESEKCDGITATPTWIINGERYIGIQSIEKLKKITGC